jgi:hypothetical protein
MSRPQKRHNTTAKKRLTEVGETGRRDMAG